MTTTKTSLGCLLGVCVACLTVLRVAPVAAQGAAADGTDPPTRVARVAYAQGAVSFQPAGTPDWVAITLNRPLTTGDQLWSDQGGRAELQMDGSTVRLSSTTAMSFLNLGDEATQIQLTAGTLLVRVRRLDDNETYEIDTPNLAFSVLRPGVYRISVDQSGNTTSVVARSGQGEATGGGAAYVVQAGEYDVFSGTDQLTENVQSAPNEDAFDAWAGDRDGRGDRSASAQYVSPDVVGYEDLDDNGTWQSTPEYGNVWYPTGVEPGWAPYRLGHWAYIVPWGYTWVDDRPWGFAPFHYGRWIWAGGAWGWAPAPLGPVGVAYVRPVYAPALVAWVGVGAGIAWFALGPREVYVPSYPVSAAYVRNINISNTTVNTTVVNNVYNTTIINNRTVNTTYVNRAVPGAITATTQQAFATAQPVSRNLVKVDPREVASASVRPVAPPVTPTMQAVIGSSRPAVAKPPAQLQTRPVVARTPPPPPPPPIERHLEAIKANGGKPLSVAELRRIQPPASARPVAVRIAPPAMPVRTARPVSGARPPLTPAPSRPVSPPAPTAVHPSELPAVPKPTSPSVANSAIERQQLQQQAALRAQQEQERHRVQQQQELEHQQLAQQQAQAARQAELERQHQAQTQELQQRHIQEQQQMQARQQQEQAQAQAQARQAKPAPARPPPKKPER